MRHLQAILRNVLTYHWASTFVIMGLLFLVGAASSYNLVLVLLANLRLISEHGWMALQDGALMLVDSPFGKMLRMVKEMPRFQVMLQTYNEQFESEIQNLADTVFIGRAVRLEADL